MDKKNTTQALFTLIIPIFIFNALYNIFSGLEVSISLPFPVYSRSIYDLDCVSFDLNCYDKLENYTTRILYIGIFLSIIYLVFYVYFYSKFCKSNFAKIVFIVTTLIILLCSPFINLILFYR
jgi:hypothetical protein